MTRALVAILLLAAGALAQRPKPSEYQVKAAYLANFGKFVEWPAKAGNGREERFNVCVLGEDPFGPALDAAVSGETITGVPMVARRVTRWQDAGGCRVLFISSSEEHQLKAVLTGLEGMDTLTVSDITDFTRRGGMLQFVLEGNRVRFEVNLQAAQQAGLNLSSELLKLAVFVRKSP